MNTPARKSKQRRGAAMVEFAIVAPILFLFFFAAFEFCRANMIRHTADNAVYEAARIGIVPGATAGDVQATATQILNSIGLQNINIQVTPTTIERDTEEVTVRASIPLDDNTFVTNVFMGGATITREITMVREGIKRNSSN